MQSKKSIILISILVVSTVLSSIGYNFYSKIFSRNVKEDAIIYIPTESSIEDLEVILSDKLNNVEDFVWVANKKKYSQNIKPGKYAIKEGMNSNELINHLRQGKQIPVKLTFNNQHSLEDLAARIAIQIEADSLSLLQTFRNHSFLEKNGFTEATAIGMYIPNSYQVYWNTSAEKFQKRMLSEYNTFWNQNRVSKAQQQKLSIEQVITLASIVQKETAVTRERPIVAGLYLNRFHKNWALQADPTVIFAIKEKYGNDTIIKRVLNKDLKIDSPYNTYKHRGIPPGPIAMPDISSIDAVLNPAQHKYFYMCASIENIGTHAFAKTLRQHNRNARKYQKWLSNLGVNR
jgi:UPF0755 protein